MNLPLRRSLTMGAACSAVGAVTALLILWQSTDVGKVIFLPAAPLAAFATSAALWWQMLERSRVRTVMRGAMAGGLSGALAHYLCWLILMLGAYGCHAIDSACFDSVGGPPLDPLNALWAAGVYSLFSLLFFGWLTVPAGAAIGALLARRAFRSTAAAGAPDTSKLS